MRYLNSQFNPTLNYIQDAAGEPTEREGAARSHLPDGHVPRAARHDEAATQVRDSTNFDSESSFVSGVIEFSF